MKNWKKQLKKVEWKHKGDKEKKKNKEINESSRGDKEKNTGKKEIAREK